MPARGLLRQPPPYSAQRRRRWLLTAACAAQPLPGPAAGVLPRWAGCQAQHACEEVPEEHAGPLRVKGRTHHLSLHTLASGAGLFWPTEPQCSLSTEQPRLDSRHLPLPEPVVFPASWRRACKQSSPCAHQASPMPPSSSSLRPICSAVRLATRLVPGLVVAFLHQLP